jgi:hypothetical protein
MWSALVEIATAVLWDNSLFMIIKHHSTPQPAAKHACTTHLSKLFKGTILDQWAGQLVVLKWIGREGWLPLLPFCRINQFVPCNQHNVPSAHPPTNVKTVSSHPSASTNKHQQINV